jgi:hypothetical protein
VIVTTSAVPPVAKPVVGLEQVSLCKLACRLLRVLAWCATNLTKDLVVEVLGDGSLGASLIDVASRGHQLLQLNAGDEVLVLGCHQAVVLGQLRNLVVALGTLRIFFEEGCTLSLGQIEKLFGVSNDRERRAPSMLSRSTSSHLALSRSCWHHWLALARQAVGVLKDLSRLRGRTLRLSGRRRSPLLLRSRLRLLALQDGGLLGRRCLCRLTGQLSMELLLLLLLLGWSLSLLKLLLLLLRWLLELMLLRALQDLRTMRARETRRHTRWHSLHTRHAGHAGERWLSLVELLLVLLRIAHTGGRLDWRCAAVLVTDTLVSQHGFDLVQAHDLPRGSGLLGGAAGVLNGRRLVLGLLLLLTLGCRLLGLQAPDVGTRLQLRNVVGVLVAFISGPSGLRGLVRGLLLILLLLLLLLLVLLLLLLVLLVLLLGGGPREALTSLVQHLLLLDGAGNLRSLAREVKVPAHTLLRGRPIVAEGIVVEGIVAVVERTTQALVCVVEVDAG